MSQSTTIHVCVTCRGVDEPLEPRAERAGARLHAALCALPAADVRITPVECLSVCKRSCTVCFAAAGKWTYVFGDLSPATAPLILATAELYGATPDGIIPWKLRPDAFKKGVVSRIPPLPTTLEPIA